ncbi:hypothetical protein [Polyangium fumosum]|uniref:Uncharacterized protein n=1 Tax=Polyangium fumosum TaxID=889272 RepID=A0A4U1JDW3_9BACT|nr:hypothetical protein [Polyangium fumosum]TKD09137.1 hypothetical protein E8A74_12680 [Polyangium fumosum]
MDSHVVSAEYQALTYQGPPDAVWYHFLHGNVPRHQIDFIYQPAIPQGTLTQQHFSHLARIVKYIEPRQGAAYAFAIANLSRDDTQYEPGRGGVAFVFGLRIKGAEDHAGRQDPPFCHSIVCVDRHLDGAAVYGSAVAFYHKLLPDQESRVEGSGWYHTYVSAVQQRSDAVEQVIRGYIQDFDDLPAPSPSGLGLRYTAENSTPPRRVVVVYPDQAPFEVLAHCAARIAQVLVESDIRWTAISNGREQDVLGGLTVRFIPERDAVQEPPDVVLVHIDQVPQDPREIAEQLFGAQEVRISQMPDLRLNWRHMMAKQAGGGSGAAMPAVPTASTSSGRMGSVRPPAMPAEEQQRARPWAKPAVEEAKPEAEKADASADAVAKPMEASDVKKKPRRQFMPIVVLGVVVALVGLGAAVWFGGGVGPHQANGPAVGQTGATVAGVPTETVVPTGTGAPTAVVTATAFAIATGESSAAVVATSSAGAVPSGAPSEASSAGTRVVPSGTGTGKKGGTVKTKGTATASGGDTTLFDLKKQK